MFNSQVGAHPRMVPDFEIVSQYYFTSLLRKIYAQYLLRDMAVSCNMFWQHISHIERFLTILSFLDLLVNISKYSSWKRHLSS
jgi:hypothetical protein